MNHKAKSNLATATVILVLVDVILIHNRPWLRLLITLAALATAALSAWAIRREKVKN
jgi:hypothetical protein